MPGAESPALRCQGLVKHYGSVQAVNGLDLEVHRGECFGLLGPNGAGKTTTVEILEGLNTPDAGEVEVLGERWHGDGLALRARLGIQLQETKYPEKARVREVVTLFRSFYPRGLGVRETLGLVQLQEKAEAQVRTLSGGQKQRTALARALLADAPFLVLDDAFSSVDTETEARILEAVKSRSGTRTVFLVSHRLSTIQHADRVVVLERGRVVETGTHEELLRAGGLYAELAERQRLSEEVEAA